MSAWIFFLKYVNQPNYESNLISEKYYFSVSDDLPHARGKVFYLIEVKNQLVDQNVK